jgi:hypothetical protein
MFPAKSHIHLIDHPKRRHASYRMTYHALIILSGALLDEKEEIISLTSK